MLPGLGVGAKTIYMAIDIKLFSFSYSVLSVLPVRSYVCTRFIQVDMLVDVIDPRHRNEVMVRSVRRTLPGQLDLVGTFEMVDFADGLSVGRNDVHVFFDLRSVRHVSSPSSGEDWKRTSA
jgi:hypothetical protein